MRLIRLSGLLLVVCSTFAFGQPAVEQARQLLGDGEFARALKVVDVALPATKDANAAAKLLLVRGQCLLALGQADKASAAFSSALKKDLGSELDEATASPQAVELLEKARAGLPALVSISVLNGEATVRVDGKPVGPAPLTLELGGGAHVIEATTRDGRGARTNLEVQPGRRVEVNLLLERPAAVAVAPVTPPASAASPGPTPTAPAAPSPAASASPAPAMPGAAAPATPQPARAPTEPALTVTAADVAAGTPQGARRAPPPAPTTTATGPVPSAAASPGPTSAGARPAAPTAPAPTTTARPAPTAPSPDPTNAGARPAAPAPSPASSIAAAGPTPSRTTAPAPAAPAAVTTPLSAEPTVSASTERPRSKIGWVPLTAGALIAGGGGVSLWQANVRYTLLTSRATLTPAQERDAVQNGPLLQTLGWVGVGLGAAAIVTGVVLLAAPPEGAPSVSALVTPHGAFVGVSGRLP
ncbi:MAG: hypothetical protein JNJ54_23885 [Myxococcaceae bacterium]|nr:hypothetical protein [Myxococcaceae bacterium]